MPTDIDSLQLKISAEASSAEKSLNGLISTLAKLSNSLSFKNTSGLSNLSLGISQLSKSMQQFKSSEIKTQDFTRISTGLSKIAGINAQGVQNAAQSINSLSRNLGGLQNLTFDSQGVANIANAISKLGRGTVTQAAQNIPVLTNALQGLASGLSGIKIDTSNIDSIQSLTSSITKLGGKSATAAASGNIENLATALKNMMTTLSTAPKVSQNVIQMAQSLAQLASAGGSAGNATRSLASSFNVFSSSSNKAKKSAGGLAAAFGKFYATYWLLIRSLGSFKKAIDISSDLTEVQNVVDVTFGDMAYKVEELSKTSIEDFGMSELTAKQISSRFQAMGTAMGFTQDKMSDMSIELTKLAADMASFYNVEQDQVATSLQSVFTGETEPLRKYGLDLSFATVEAWALAQGIDADMQSMTQAQKTMLRYQYVMANTTAAQGDFARTSNSWANQVRILAQNFEQLGSVIGGTLINAFKPFVQALNNVMGAIINFAQVVSNALGAIFGWEYQVGGGITDDYESAAGAADDLAGSTGDAADNAKKLKSYLLGIDELNVLEPDTGDSGSGSGGGGGGAAGAGAGDGGQWVETESLWEKYTSDIDTLYELGEYIGKTLTDAMNSIDWESIYEGARNFGTGLANFLNGLISPELFGATGRTIASALNTAIYAALSFGQTFDWTDLGLSIANGINEFFRTFDFKSLATTINTFASGIFDTIFSALDNVDWGMIGEKIGEFISDIDFIKVLKNIGKSIWKAINSAFEAYEGMFETAPLETALLSLVGVTKLLDSKNIKNFAKAIQGSISNVQKFAAALTGSESALKTLETTMPKTAKVVDTLLDSFSALKMGVESGDWITGIGTAFENIRSKLSATQKGVITTVSAFAEFGIVSDSVSDLVTSTGSLGTNIAELATGATAASVAMYTALGPTGLAISAITGIVAAIKGVVDAQKEMAENSAMGEFANEISALSDEVSQKTESIRSNLISIQEGVESAGVAEANMARDLAEQYKELASKTNLTAGEQIQLKSITEQLTDLVPDLSGYIDEQTGYLDIQNGTLDALINNMELYAQQQAAQESLIELYKQQYEAQSNVLNAQRDYQNAAEEIIASNEGLSDSVKNMIREGDIQGLRDLVLELQNGQETIDQFGVRTGAAAGEMINLVEEAYGAYSKTLSEAEKVNQDVTESIDYMKSSLEDTTEAIYESDQAISSVNKNSTEFQQSLKDIKQEFSDLGITISDSFAETLAMDDSGMLGSITEAFSKMSNQVQLSSDELQQLFSNIAPGMSAGFIESLAAQSPEMQSQIALTMADMASGADVSSEQIKTVFSTLGYEIPNSVAQSFSEQGGVLQTSTIDLLANIESGKAQVEGNLLQIFDGLGITLPNELIGSLADAEPETQQAAINLLMQIASGCDMSASEITSRFADLGLSIPNTLQSAISSGEATTYLQASELINQIAEAGNDEESQRLAEQYNTLGYGIIDDGLLAAFSDETKREEARSGALGLLDSIISAADGAEKEEAILKFNNFGSELVDSYNSGVSDNSDKTVDTMNDWMGKAERGIHDSVMKYGSPSKTAIQYGMDTVLGFNQGISENTQSSIDTINSWMTSVQESMSPEQWSLMFSNILPAFQTAWGTVTEWWNSTAMPEFWSNISTITFSVENWTTLFNSIPTALQTKWNEASNWWTKTAMPKFWKSAQDWFSNKRWTELLEQVRLAFETKWTEIEKLLSEIMLKINQNFATQIRLMQTNWISALDVMQNDFISTFDAIEADADSAINSIISKVNNAISAINRLKAAMASVGGSGGISVGLNIQGYASGGFPEMGELFLANETGSPEFIGSIGGRTAVANNDQIVQGIASGVAAAMMTQNELLTQQNQLLLEILNKDTSINLDGRELVAGIDERRVRNGFSFSG